MNSCASGIIYLNCDSCDWDDWFKLPQRGNSKIAMGFNPSNHNVLILFYPQSGHNSVFPTFLSGGLKSAATLGLPLIGGNSKIAMGFNPSELLYFLRFYPAG
ncbi:MAG: hypothetical protein LBP87_03110 [Planctomycetaceae bacterium]|nr:hypothetical protein [Planctomycetaceae bacterium]